MSENIPKDDLSDGHMSLMDHLTELRSRLLLSIVVFIILFLVCLVRIGDPSSSIADQVYLFLQKPLADLLVERGGRMIFTGLHEGFFTQIKVAFFTSISISLPIILIQVWKFIEPGLYFCCFIFLVISWQLLGYSPRCSCLSNRLSTRRICS